MITQSEAPEPEEILVHKPWSDISALSVAIGETSSGLTRGTRTSVKPEKLIPKKKYT